MSDAIKEIAKACQALEGKEFSPSVVGTYHLLLHASYFLFYNPNYRCLCTFQLKLCEPFISKLPRFMFLDYAHGCEQQARK